MKRLFLPAFLLLGLTFAVGQASQASDNQASATDTTEVAAPPVVDQITDHSVELRWTTAHAAATRVSYGTNQNDLSLHGSRNGNAREHELILSNLQPRTTYYYEVEHPNGKDKLTGTFTTH